MKNTVLILCLLGITFISCKDKKSATTTTDEALQETITKMEQENKELKTLDDGIEKDINELDDLLKELDE